MIDGDAPLWVWTLWIVVGVAIAVPLVGLTARLASHRTIRGAWAELKDWIRGD